MIKTGYWLERQRGLEKFTYINFQKYGDIHETEVSYHDITSIMISEKEYNDALVHYCKSIVVFDIYLNIFGNG